MFLIIQNGFSNLQGAYWYCDAFREPAWHEAVYHPITAIEDCYDYAMSKQDFLVFYSFSPLPPSLFCFSVAR